MDARTDPQASANVEQAVRQVCAAYGPDPAAVARIETQLLARARLAHLEPAPGLIAQCAAPGLRWALAAIAVVVALTLATAIIGPQRVLASLQRLIGYLPGVGFVDEQQTRMLSA